MNEEWEREGERSWSWCPEVEDRQREDGKEKQGLKFEPIMVCVSVQ